MDRITDSHMIGFGIGLIAAAGVLYYFIPKKHDTRFKKNDKRTRDMARLGGYARWDRDGKRRKF